jgi:hypothetical protein
MIRRLLTCAAILVLGGRLNAADDPLTVNVAADATLSGTKAGDQGPSGKAPGLRLMAGDEKHRIVLCFDLKDTRPCAAAVLRLVTDKCWINEKQQYIRVHRLLRPFQENRASWNNSYEIDSWINLGGDFDPNAFCARKMTKNDAGEGKVIELNVTPLVQAWQAKTIPNFGLLLTLDDGSDMNIHFHSKESAEADKRPQLLLYYGATPPKIPEMMAPTTLKPIGGMPQLKMELMFQGSSSGKVGSALKCNYFGRGGIAPYTFKATGLPEGLALAPDGTLSGTPVKAGTYKVAVTAEGADRHSTSKTFEVVIAEATKEGDPKKDPAGGTPKKPGKNPEEE